MTLIYISPTPEHPNGYTVSPTMEKPEVKELRRSTPTKVDYEHLDYLRGKYESHLLTLPVYATCSPNKWKHGQELKEGVDFEIKQEYCGGRMVKEYTADHQSIPSHYETYTKAVAVPLDKQEIKT